MTGFARQEGQLEGWSWAVEARSVNGRNLDVRFRGPPGFDGLERAAREAAQLALDRARPAVALSEPLASRAMELAAARGSMVDLKRSFAELGAVIDELDPGCWPVLTHEERYRQLAERLRTAPAQASFAAMEAAPRSTSPSAPAAL